MSAISPREIRLALEKRLYDLLKIKEIPLSDKNKGFDPKKAKNRIWARPTTKLGKIRTIERGEGPEPLGSRVGVFIVQIFLAPGISTVLGEDLCEEVERMFRLINIEGVNCEEPYTEEIGLDSDKSWYQFNVTVPYWAWVGN